MKKRGFTLIELLSVIIIIGVIGIVAVPSVIKSMDKAKEDSYKSSCDGIFRAVKYYLSDNKLLNPPLTGILVNQLDLDNKDEFKTGSVYKNTEGEITLVNVSNGEYCAVGQEKNLTITAGECDSSIVIDLEKPVIDANYGGGNITMNLTDNVGLYGYIISTENKNTGNYELISGKTYTTEYPVEVSDKYYIFVKDKLGNVASTEVEVFLEGTTWSYDYINKAQKFTVPTNGNYKLEAWGAGGSSIGVGNYYASDNRWNSSSWPIGVPRVSYGNYATGKVYLTKNDTIYVYTGKARDSSGWQGTNKGGPPVTVTITWLGRTVSETSNTSGYYSSGATDFRIIKSGELDGWSGTASLESRIVTAGGAGALGQKAHCRADYNQSRATYTYYVYDNPANLSGVSNTILGTGSIGYSTMGSITRNDGNYYTYSWTAYGGGGGGYYGGTAGNNGTSLIKNYTNVSNGKSYTLTDSLITTGVNSADGYAKITYISN